MATREDIIPYLAQRFKEHSESIYSGASAQNSSPLYAYLCQQIATDPDILILVANADMSTTITNLFFGAVHFLLLGDVEHPLQAFYPDLSSSVRPIREVYPYFRDFCLSYANEIRELVTTQRVQTNEVRRCAALFPAFTLLATRISSKPLALVEIGTSAGLHLRWDKYSYDYGTGRRTGTPESPVQIVSELRGLHHPPLDFSTTVTYRLGLDINPIDIHDARATRWLRALIWPEHADRMHLLEQALTVAKHHPQTLIKGDASVVLPEILALVPQDAILCIYHSYTLNQMPKDVRERILGHITDYAKQRDFYRISQEGYSLEKPPRLELHTYHNGETRSELLAFCESHERWIEWCAEN